MVAVAEGRGMECVLETQGLENQAFQLGDRDLTSSSQWVQEGCVAPVVTGSRKDGCGGGCCLVSGATVAGRRGTYPWCLRARELGFPLGRQGPYLFLPMGEGGACGSGRQLLVPQGSGCSGGLGAQRTQSLTFKAVNERWY